VRNRADAHSIRAQDGGGSLPPGRLTAGRGHRYHSVEAGGAAQHRAGPIFAPQLNPRPTAEGFLHPHPITGKEAAARGLQRSIEATDFGV